MPDHSVFEIILADLRREISSATSADELAALRTSYLGRNGRLTQALRQVGSLPAAQRQAAGKQGNVTKQTAETLFTQAMAAFSTDTHASFVDPTLPGIVPPRGHLHPITLVLRELTEIFTSLGFSVADGPEVETDWYNFEALNMNIDHPARDMQDTFYVAGSDDRQGHFRLLPRTHTSGVQIRTMENQDPPIRVVVPGLTYRNENEDTTHSAVFHQMEGLMVDTTTSFADLKGILLTMAHELLGAETKLRFRPSYFPYTEPSAEIDMSSPNVLGGKWIELGGAGMVHPQVLQNVGYDPVKYRGFAFGVGPVRLAMLKYGIGDVREFFKPDVRLLEQF